VRPYCRACYNSKLSAEDSKMTLVYASAGPTAMPRLLRQVSAREARTMHMRVAIRCECRRSACSNDSRRRVAAASSPKYRHRTLFREMKRTLLSQVNATNASYPCGVAVSAAFLGTDIVNVVPWPR
jgi:hypothetical protein